MNKGKLIVLSAPSGCGKSTIVEKLMVSRCNLKFSISATTRKPREGEVDGVHYFFVTRDKFMDMVDADEFLEYAIYVDNCYGTPRKPVEEGLDAGCDVILDIEYQGAFQVREKYPEALLVFLMPPSFEELEKRLIARGKDSVEVIRERLETAKIECAQADKYDYIIVNDEVDRAVSEFISVIEKEKNN